MESLVEEGINPPKAPEDLLALPLIGAGSSLKSIALVAVLVGVEQRLSEHHGIDLSLMDERAMSQARSPFRTVGTLADYIQAMVSERAL